MQNTSLEQLLRRPDIWRGHSNTFSKVPTVDSGYPALNQALQHQGWPLSCLIEVCQSYHACEWWLFHPAIRSQISDNTSQYLALLNPPALPFISGLKQLNIPSKQMIVVQATTLQEFVTCFIELGRSKVCSIVFAWQPNQTLTYTQLRKLQLNTTDESGLYVIFRHQRAQSYSSPASLRLSVKPMDDNLHIHIFKQKGKLHLLDIALPIPLVWKKIPPHNDLHRHGPKSFPYDTSTKGQVPLFPTISFKPSLKHKLKRE